jgi:hypothetical protein
MICKYDFGQCLSAIARELDYVVLTVNTIVTDIAHIEEHVGGKKQ